MSGTHKTRIVENVIMPGARAVFTHSLSDGRKTDTRLEISPVRRGFYEISVEQFDKSAKHKRGVTRSVSFIISRAGFEYLCGVAS